MANGLIDYCICIEMVGFAIAHAFTFTYKEYLPSTVEEAMATYERAAQEQQDGSSDEEDRGGSEEGQGGPAYHPPETLSRPMKFKDAFWSSTVPNETLHDIRRLRDGVDRAAQQITDPGTISMQDMLALHDRPKEAEQRQQPRLQHVI